MTEHAAVSSGRTTFRAGTVLNTDQTKDLKDIPEKIEEAVISLIPEEVARKYHVVAFERDKDALKVAATMPQDIEALNALGFLAEKDKLSIQLYRISNTAFDQLMAHYSRADKALKEAILSLKTREDESDDTLPKQGQPKTHEDLGIFQDAPISKLVQVVIEHAMDGQASDIHIEPVEKNYRVRFRVDGMLYASLTLPLEVGRAVVARIKILANLKIDEKRKPQDGRFRIERDDNTIDLRVSTLPVVEGEKVVLRVLDKSQGLANLDTLGVVGKNAEVLGRKIREPYGLILLTGPTGSGKSTTLYAFLSILNKEEKNIITLEDPVEYFVGGINQSQVKPEIGYTFASGLRSILRQDPNVIMVGEIRDSETAELAVHAALTGHLVFSTLHTNDAIGAIPRLVDMGIEPFLLASSLQAIAAQRLVRRICKHCPMEKKYSPAILERVGNILAAIPPGEFKKYGLTDSQANRFFVGKGCAKCNDTGYKGRLALVEVLEVNTRLQEIITEKRGNETAVQAEAQAQKMMSMKQDGLLKVLKGLTTLAEVQRVTEGDLLVDEE